MDRAVLHYLLSGLLHLTWPAAAWCRAEGHHMTCACILVAFCLLHSACCSLFAASFCAMHDAWLFLDHCSCLLFVALCLLHSICFFRLMQVEHEGFMHHQHNFCRKQLLPCQEQTSLSVFACLMRHCEACLMLYRSDFVTQLRALRAGPWTLS